MSDNTQTRTPRYSTNREVLEELCEIEFIKGSGPGGQHRNKRETGIRLRHPPSGVVLVATERRSQVRNRELAFERLIERLEKLNFVPKTRRPSKVTRNQKAKRLRNKRANSDRKKMRKAPTSRDW